jgi:hypothetical protein
MRLYLIIGVIVAIIGLYGYAHHSGYKERDAEMQAEIAAKNEEARAKEQELNKQINDNAAKLQEANHAIDEKQSALDRAIRAGRLRFPASSCVQASTNSASTSGSGDAAPSESDAETLRLIAQIAADGDRAILQLNACVDAYNKVMESVNGQR